MSTVLQPVDPLVALARAHTVLDELQALDLTGVDDESLLAYWRELERLRRRLPTLDHQLVLEAEQRGVAEAHQARSTAAFVRALLRVDAAEAAGRVRAARSTGARRALSGQPLEPEFPHVAAAQADGQISEQQARIIRTTVERLPERVRAQFADQIERELVGFADQFDPVPLARLAERIRYCYDPDGALDDVNYRDKQRSLMLRRRPDGSGTLNGELTAELAELLDVHFDALAKPASPVDSVKDPRTAEQRRHDALLDALKLNVRARQLPRLGGVAATIVVTMTAEQYLSGTGLARTSHGALVPTRTVLQWAGGDYRLMNVVLDRTKGITAYSSLHRLFTEQQRLALLAADPGCTFPNCPMPAHWCEIDHVVEYANGGPTRVDFGVPACRHHNVHAKKQGWRSTRIDGRAAWIPPRWIDPQQRPRYNHLHNLEPPP